tara:strand:- start:263 stop:559 length:297 start_codon:yes stop_codon:yes gene_type:complete
MSMKNQAIYSLYPKAVSIGGNAKIILDANDKDITDTIDMKAVEAKAKELQADYDAKEYQRKRASEYPSTADQLDDLYHNGIDGWKETIKAIKDKHPKE